MKTTTSCLLLLAGGLHTTFAYGTTPNHSLYQLLRRDDDDPTDFSWVKRWAAVGDSYTAGIGSGNPLGKGYFTIGDSNYQCSRYDTSYPMIVNDALGSSVEDFQFAACSGDRTGNIYEQINDLDGDLDLVIMTAGGNDLCLSSMIKSCVFVPYNEESCEDVIAIAKDNLDNIMGDNFKQLLDALDKKMADDSVVVFNGYAQFFNTENEDCAEDEDWTLFNPTDSGTPLKLTVDRRKTFNGLVNKLNDIIHDTVNDARKADKYKYKIGFSNWDYWSSKVVRGQYCDPDSTGAYPDKAVPDLQFFKPDTRPSNVDVGEREAGSAKRATAENEADLAKQLNDEVVRSPSFRRTRNPQHLAHQRLARGMPERANCPGDADQDAPDSGGGWTPDVLGKNFHPNELGHYTIASWALQTAIDLRAEVLGIDQPSCDYTDKFECFSDDEDSTAYASEPRLNERAKDFCDDVEDNYPKGENGWSWSKKYDEGTPDETEFKMELSQSTDSFSPSQCRDSMSRIINGCDGGDKDTNPMDWKFGGRWKRGDHTYTVTPQRNNRPWPKDGEDGGGEKRRRGLSKEKRDDDGGPIQEPYGKCVSWYKVFYSEYRIYGAGWASWDYGQDELLPAIRDCVGGGVKEWKFKYYDEPTEDGYEWRADFHTPIWTNARCFDNNKAVMEAGGFTDGCEGTG
ncbi:SGNH/GDSL hydrolase family protein [Aspergillus lucknowensis]|uniref:SGNH hydrolase-type esterase domain-containing protein n=1 Tax=Aspergillus lucknowensis TaxID=176173 RepID=A0ABR4LH57_9EURO